MATFESQNRRMPKIEACLKANGLESLDACNEMLLAKGIDCDKIIRGIHPGHCHCCQARPEERC